MSDRELLEMAAKAAGAKPYDWDTSGDGLFIKDGVPVILHNGDHEADWNPLTDDGDALRLAVKLGLSLNCPSDEYHQVFATEWHALGPAVREDVPNGVDPCAATRRAITRVAAAIGASA